MTKHTISRVTPYPIQIGRFCNNGQRPQAPVLWRAVLGIDHAQHYLKKGLTFLSWASIAAASGNVEDGWAFLRTGVGTTRLRLMVGLGDVGIGGATPTDAHVYIVATPWGGSPVTSAEIHYTPGSSGLGPDHTFHASVDITVSPDTEYDVALHRVGWARVLYWTLLELPVGVAIDDTEDGAASPAPFLVEGPIYDAQVSDVLVAADRVFRCNGSHLINESAQDGGTDPDQTTSSSFAAPNVGWEWSTPIDQHCRLTHAFVPVVFAVRMATAGGSTNAVRIIDADSSAQLLSVSGFTSSGWKRVIGEIPAATRAVEVQFKSDGSNQISLYAYSLFEFDGSIALPAATHSLDLEGSSSQDASISDANQIGLDITGTLTLAAWVRIESLPPSGFAYTVLSKWNETGNQRSYRLTLVNTGGTHTVRLTVSGNGTNLHEREFTWTPSTATWYHLAFTYDPNGSGIANQFAGYLDGAAQTEATVTDSSVSTIFNSTSDVEVGGNANGSTLHYDGMIHSAQIWSRVLTAAEVDAIHDAEITNALMTLPQTGLQAWWVTHNNYGDNSPNGNVLTPGAAPAFSATVP